MLKSYIFLQTKRIKIYTIEYADQVLEKDIMICFIDFQNYQKYEQRMLNNDNILFIITHKNHNNFVYNSKFFNFSAPFEIQELDSVLGNILKNIQDNSIIVQVPHEGEKHIFLKNLNYINIVHRNLCFHLIDQQDIMGFTIRQSFEKEVKKYLKHDELFFLKPGEVINVSNIDKLSNDHIVFRNGAVLYYPKSKYNELRKYWKQYYFIDDNDEE